MCPNEHNRNRKGEEGLKISEKGPEMHEIPGEEKKKEAKREMKSKPKKNY